METKFGSRGGAKDYAQIVSNGEYSCVTSSGIKEQVKITGFCALSPILALSESLRSLPKGTAMRIRVRENPSRGHGMFMGWHKKSKDQWLGSSSVSDH